MPDDRGPAPKGAISVDAITASPVESAPVDPDAQTNLEKADLTYARQWAELSDYQQDIDARRTYAKAIFVFMCLWVVGMYSLLVFQGITYHKFHLSDSVLITAIGSTTASVIGVFLIVTRYFFPKR
jgi:hypothetical protein